jgi:putative ABC transport system ATP-binding protein
MTSVQERTERPAATSIRPTIALQGIRKTYGAGENAVHAVRNVDLTVMPGEYVAIMGASGSGKSTLMNIVGCLDAPSAGRYLLDGVDVRRLDEDRLSVIRNRKIGFIFQSYNMIPRTTALSNVELPLIYAHVPAKERRERAMEALDKVGLADRRNHLPSELSGGQQQRVAVARAIVTDPVLLLADEPTGALDSKSTADVLDLFDELSDAGRTIMVITHEDEVGSRAQRLVVMRDGLIVSQSQNRPGPGTVPAMPVQLQRPAGGLRGTAAEQQARAAYQNGGLV